MAPADLDRYYARVDFRRWEIAGYFPTERYVIEMLRALPRGSRILDFGCSSGRLLAQFCDDYKCYGVEVNEAAAAAAAEKGIGILQDVDWHSRDAPKFDAIVMVDVFEHLTQPHELLKELVRLLAPDGRLIVVTGNGDARACRRDPASFWYFRHIEHLCMLTHKHAGFLCSTLGLQLERWAELTHYDLTFRDNLTQILQNFVFWQFRNRTFLAQTVLKFLPGMTRLRTGLVAPSYTRSRDHVAAVFRNVSSI